MKSISTALLSTLAVLSMVSTGAIANPTIPASIDRTLPNISTIPNLTIALATVSGKITNGGSNNGGQPNFQCSDIKIYAATQTIPAPSGDFISLPEYKKVSGYATVSGGSAAAGCTYSLNLTGKALNQTVYLITTNPQTWTTMVNSVEISPSDGVSSLKLASGQALQGKNLYIHATLIK
jgi:hypothetical protein